MLEIHVPEREFYDERNEVFIKTRPVILQLEHSLMSVSRWESKWRKPFLTDEDKTRAETMDYIRCMTINRDVDPNVYAALTSDDIQKIMDYVGAELTATKVYRVKSTNAPKKTITSEVIYSWMVMYNVPFECQKWHISRLLKLLDVLEIANNPKNKMSKGETARSNAALNKARRAKLHSKG